MLGRNVPGQVRHREEGIGPTIAISHGRQYVVALPCPLGHGRTTFNKSFRSRHRGHEVCRRAVVRHAPMQPATAGNWNDQPLKRHQSPLLVQQGRGKGRHNVNHAVGQ
jgi:hypothetical protein